MKNCSVFKFFCVRLTPSSLAIMRGNNMCAITQEFQEIFNGIDGAGNNNVISAVSTDGQYAYLGILMPFNSEMIPCIEIEYANFIEVSYQEGCDCDAYIGFHVRIDDIHNVVEVKQSIPIEKNSIYTIIAEVSQDKIDLNLRKYTDINNTYKLFENKYGGLRKTKTTNALAASLITDIYNKIVYDTDFVKKHIGSGKMRVGDFYVNGDAALLYEYFNRIKNINNIKFTPYSIRKTMYMLLTIRIFCQVNTGLLEIHDFIRIVTQNPSETFFIDFVDDIGRIFYFKKQKATFASLLKIWK